MALKILKTIVTVLLILVCGAVLKFCLTNRENETTTRRDRVLYFIIGIIVNFFDVLGIGSFAPTLALYNTFDLKVPERYIGGTLNAGVAGVVLFEALLFLSSVDVDMKTMILMEICAIAGTFLGVKANEKVKVNTIRYIMSAGLMMAALLMLFGRIGILPIGGTLRGLTGGSLVIACVVAFILGAALMFGIGNYAPCMSVVYLLGMNPLCAFPIMMCMGGFCSSSSAFQSIKNGLIIKDSALFMMLGGFIGAAVAYFVVKSMPLNVLTILVIIVVFYASISLFLKARKSAAAEKAGLTADAE